MSVPLGHLRQPFQQCYVVVVLRCCKHCGCHGQIWAACRTSKSFFKVLRRRDFLARHFCCRALSFCFWARHASTSRPNLSKHFCLVLTCLERIARAFSLRHFRSALFVWARFWFRFSASWRSRCGVTCLFFLLAQSCSWTCFSAAASNLLKASAACFLCCHRCCSALARDGRAIPKCEEQHHQGLSVSLFVAGFARSCTTSTAPCNGALQWHPAMAPRPLNHSTLQWHPATAPSNAIAHYNGTLQWHHVDCTLLWHSGATSNAQEWFVALPLLEVRTPIAMAIWGKNILPTILYLTVEVLSKHVRIYVPFYVLLQCLLVYGLWFKSSWLKWFLCVCVLRPLAEK